MGRRSSASPFDERYEPHTGKHGIVKDHGRHKPEELELIEPRNPANTGPRHAGKKKHRGAGVVSVAATGALMAVVVNHVVAGTESHEVVEERLAEPEPITADILATLAPAKVEVTSIPAPPPAPEPPPAPVTEVTVKPGDTVADLAAAHGVDMYKMLAANGLGPYDLIYVGDVLKLDGPPIAVTPVQTPAPATTIVVPPLPPALPQASVGAQARQAIINSAFAQIGRFQDCTMLVTNALAQARIYHHGWPISYFTLGYQVSRFDALPGDLVYYQFGGAPGTLAHIAVYAGNGRAVHGGWNGNETREWSVDVGSGPVFIRVT